VRFFERMRPEKIPEQSLREFSRAIVTKVARDTAEILHTRNSLGDADDCFEGIEEAAFLDEAENLATGEECGCLEPDEAVEQSLMVWVEKQISERIAQQDSEIERLNLDNVALLNSAGVWRNRAINAEEELAGTNRLRKSRPRKRTDQQLQPKGEQG
jgi:uncharacterized small protein (DUF1192 family)